MILIDLNQVLLGGLMAQINSKKSIKLEEDLVRHMVLNTIRFNVKQFKEEYGNVVLCCDNRKYWRKEFFPFYKAGRKKAREKSDLDWHLIFDMLSKFKQELKENFPYKVIDVAGAEADDVIGTLVPEYSGKEKIIILSSDGDFLQLQQYSNVKQYNPSLKKYIKSENPLLELKEKIIRGDKGDGIPNILSPGDCFVRDIKQRSVTKGILEKFLNEDYANWEDDVARTGFSRNQVLIDLSLIPEDIKQNIINTFNETKPASRQKMLTYFIEFKLKNLMDVIEEF
jgi:hypothetical protein